MSTPFPNAAEMLEGHSLERGWKVIEKMTRHPSATGGCSSVGYRVENTDGRHGFLKALDYSSAFTMPNVVEALHTLTSEYISERDLHEKTRARRMSRIIVALDAGQTRIPGCRIEQVDYIIFELAEGDIRQHLSTTTEVDTVLCLNVLHNIAVGLRQLHGSKIAHQDVKPSNIFMMQEGRRAIDVSKLGDLGRATDANRPALHDSLLITGDRTYAPPEQLYGEHHADFGRRRIACDLYQLGSIVSFLFLGAPMNSLVHEELHPIHRWNQWRGTYREVLPYVVDAFGKVLGDAEEKLPTTIGKELTRIIQYLCEPDPFRRGYPGRYASVDGQYSLQKAVSQFDRLARMAVQKEVAGVA
jgi:eukaryotic-like serine/threonine-protein kinase